MTLRTIAVRELERTDAEIELGVEYCDVAQWGTTTMVKLTTGEGNEAIGMYVVLKDMSDAVKISIARSSALRRLYELLERKERKQDRNALDRPTHVGGEW